MVGASRYRLSPKQILVKYSQKIITIVFIFFFIFFFISVSYGLLPYQPTFDSENLKRLFELLSEDLKHQLSAIQPKEKSTIILDVMLHEKEYPLVMKYNHLGEITHLGISSIKKTSDEENYYLLVNYLERCLLKWIVLESNDRILEDMETEKIELLINKQVVQTNFGYSIWSYLMQIDPTKYFNVKKDNGNFHVFWELDLLTHIELIFPVNIYTISGKRKDELEKEFQSHLKTLPPGKISEVNPKSEKLIMYNEHLLILKGLFYENDKEVSSHMYFEGRDQYVPVFSEDFPLESISNLFLNIVDADAKINVKISIYGRFDEPFTQNINDLMSFLGKNNELYFGWQEKGLDHLKASIFIQNSFFDYIHILVITTDIDCLFNHGDDINGVLYAYIPKHNINE